MHQYAVTFLPLGPEGRTTERIITAASWSPGDEWIDFRDQAGGVTHRVVSGCVLSVEVLPQTASSADIAAEALAQNPGEPLNEASTADGAAWTSEPRWADRHERESGTKVATVYVDVAPRLGRFRDDLAAGLRELADDIAGSRMFARNLTGTPEAVLTPAQVQKLRDGLDDSGAASPSPESPSAARERLGLKPQIGDRVHYVSDDGACLPARVFDIGTLEINEHDPAGDRRYREALSLIVTPPHGGEHPVGRVVHESGTYSAGARFAQPGEPMPLITCADMTYPAGTWHWPAGDQA